MMAPKVYFDFNISYDIHTAGICNNTTNQTYKAYFISYNNQGFKLNSC